MNCAVLNDMINGKICIWFCCRYGCRYPGRVEKRTYGNPEADKIGPKHSKNVKKIKKPLERHTKTYSPLCDDGKNELIFFKRVSTL